MLFLEKLVLSDDMHFLDLIILISNSINVRELELLRVIFWRVWFYRNQLVHKLGNSYMDDVINWATNFLDE